MPDEYFKDFDAWNEQAKLINKSIFQDYFHEREIWWCALGVNIGSEQDGKSSSFERPVLVVKKINDDLLLIAPLTSKIKDDWYRIFPRNRNPAIKRGISGARNGHSDTMVTKPT